MAVAVVVEENGNDNHDTDMLFWNDELAAKFAAAEKKKRKKS